MAMDKRMLLYSSLILLVSSIVNIEAQSCGGTYTSDYGFFMSPNFPDVYDLDVDCTYRISLPANSQITIRFEIFELDRSPQDYISIDCESKQDVTSNYTWSANIAPRWVSSCMIGRVFFHSDSYRNYATRGFKVQYTASTIECGKTAYSVLPSATISSPNYPQNYNNDNNCTYSIWEPEPSSFTLTFLAFDLQSDSNCLYDWLQIECADASFILPKYCGSTLPNTVYISNCNEILIWFHTDGSAVYSGFSLQYSVTPTPEGCGGAYTANYGVFTSPNYPNVYGIDVDCTYRISLPVTSQITIRFEVFELDGSPQDYVSVDCESSSTDMTLNYTWNANIPPRWLSFCRIGRVYFHSDSIRNYSTRGFKVQYTASTEGCDKTAYSGSSGTISSPNYPENYNNNENCTYSIWAPESSSFTLTFQAFNLESSANCQYDWLQIQCADASYISPKHCGSMLPYPIHVLICNEVLIWFHTDGSTVLSGFSLQYSVTPTPEGCEEIYTADYGVFTSPNYPDVYDLNVDCTYRIYLPAKSQITIRFEIFELDGSPQDYVSVDCESSSTDMTLNYTWNANIPPRWLSFCRIGRVYFHSDSIRNYSTRGFRVQYTASTEGCDKTAYSGSSGTISSPNYPENYNNDENCTYSIWAQESSSFTLTFQAFNLQTDSNCQYDWLQIQCADASYISPKYCGSTLPNPIYVHNCNEVLIWFHTDGSTVLSGFSLQYSVTPTPEVGCGETSTSDYGVFTSPNYPDVYDLNVDCTYRISLPTTRQIMISFETFELDRSSGDYVVVDCESRTDDTPYNYTWNTRIAPKWLPFCSIGRVYFHSDSYRDFPTRGIKVLMQASTEGCDNTAYSVSPGTISSPNYPENYNNDENCTYSIWATESSSFTLTFQAFQLESASDCQYDWVKIRCDNSSYILPKYCGSTLPKPVHISNCNQVLIWFHTDGSTVYSGFSLQYSVTPDGCGKSNYTGLSGIITSPNYPKKYDKVTCYYYIYPVSSVALAFQSFDLEPFIDLTNSADYVQVTCISNTSLGTGYYYGNTLPPLISYEQCSCVRVLLFTNHAVAGTGFNLKYHVNPLVAHSAITTAPKNFTVNVGSRVQLDCTSDAIKYFPSWTLSTDGTDDNSKVIASFCVVNSDYTSQYSVVNDKPGVCNLVIESATQANAGIYTCIDVGLASASSVVTILA